MIRGQDLLDVAHGPVQGRTGEAQVVGGVEQVDAGVALDLLDDGKQLTVSTGEIASHRVGAAPSVDPVVDPLESELPAGGVPGVDLGPHLSLLLCPLEEGQAASHLGANAVARSPEQALDCHGTLPVGGGLCLLYTKTTTTCLSKLYLLPPFEPIEPTKKNKLRQYHSSSNPFKKLRTCGPSSSGSYEISSTSSLGSINTVDSPIKPAYKSNNSF